VRQELASASVFGLVSLEENAPLGIEEAMAAGVPVVASNRCGMPYMVSHGETGFLVDPLSVDDITRRLQQLLENAGLRRMMGEAARDIAQERFHPSAVARRTRQVYLEAAGVEALPPSRWTTRAAEQCS
jgi:glycosyltransferase involved in cell wall biosynthesis